MFFHSVNTNKEQCSNYPVAFGTALFFMCVWELYKCTGTLDAHPYMQKEKYSQYVSSHTEIV